jgi:hypothetical protein
VLLLLRALAALLLLALQGASGPCHRGPLERQDLHLGQALRQALLALQLAFEPLALLLLLLLQVQAALVQQVLLLLLLVALVLAQVLLLLHWSPAQLLRLRCRQQQQLGRASLRCRTRNLEH